MTTTTTRCKSCHGTKKQIGMGMIEKPCIGCNGLGVIQVTTVEKKAEPKQAKTILDLTKKKSSVTD